MESYGYGSWDRQRKQVNRFVATPATRHLVTPPARKFLAALRGLGVASLRFESFFVHKIVHVVYYTGLNESVFKFCPAFF